MTSAPYQPYPPSEPLDAEPKSNTLGLVGFIVSIIGIVSCGLLAPVSLVLSLVGLRKEPRGFAIAGTIISLIGCVVLLLMALIVGSGIWAFGKMGNEISFAAAAEVIGKQGSTLPTDAEGQALIDAEMREAAQLIAIPQYRRVSDTTYQLTLPGADGQLGTGDDVSTIVDATVGYEFNPGVEAGTP